ncbi:MAG: hypothetical protein J6331_01045, partial [Lentisphaeria bacterium]|nr:hypothetical protein [Lentisphaeria bacterium]
RATDRFVTPCDRGEAPFSDIPYDITFHRVLSRDFSVGDREKVFKYLHVNGAHDPVRTDENLDYDSASGKVRQLRGSLKIVELLFGKLKEAGLYDRATIVVLGDHTEFYTPEVLAFIKRRGESHPFLRYNSVPCRVSDIAGTVLKETYPVPGLKSLFDLRSVPGNGKCRESVRFENVPFSPWKKVSSMPAPGKLFPYSKSYSAEDGKRLVISPDCEEYETPLEFSLFVKDIASENIWESHSLPHRKEEVRGYLISQDLTLPDGIYQVILQTSVPGLAGTEFQALPRYLQSSRGKIAFSRQASAVSSRAMLPGETIRFRPLQYVPQIVFSRDVSFGENYVVLGRDQCVGIHLPALESPAELEWKMQGPLLQEGGTLSLLEKDTVLAKIAVKDPRDLAVSVTVPPGKERILFFRFEFAVPRRERDIRAISPTLRLFSISLRPRAGAEKR